MQCSFLSLFEDKIRVAFLSINRQPIVLFAIISLSYRHRTFFLQRIAEILVHFRHDPIYGPIYNHSTPMYTLAIFDARYLAMQWMKQLTDNRSTPEVNVEITPWSTTTLGSLQNALVRTFRGPRKIQKSGWWNLPRWWRIVNPLRPFPLNCDRMDHVIMRDQKRCPCVNDRR